MPIELQLIAIYSARRYDEHQIRRPKLAQAYLTIINWVTGVQLSNGDVDELLGFLSGPHRDTELASASRDVIQYIGVY